MVGVFKTETSFVAINENTGTLLFQSISRWLTRVVASEYEELGVPVTIKERSVIRATRDGHLVKITDRIA